MAKMLALAIEANNPKAIKITDGQKGKWADTFRLMRQRDKLTQADIEKTLDWTFKDGFWCEVIQSADGLRRNWNQITKKMQKNGGGSLRDRAERLDQRIDEDAGVDEIPF